MIVAMTSWLERRASGGVDDDDDEEEEAEENEAMVSRRGAIVETSREERGCGEAGELW